MAEVVAKDISACDLTATMTVDRVVWQRLLVGIRLG